MTSLLTLLSDIESCYRAFSPHIIISLPFNSMYLLPLTKSVTETDGSDSQLPGHGHLDPGPQRGQSSISASCQQNRALQGRDSIDTSGMSPNHVWSLRLVLICTGLG